MIRYTVYMFRDGRWEICITTSQEASALWHQQWNEYRLGRRMSYVRYRL